MATGVDRRAPVLVGVGAAVQHLTDPRDGRSAFELMVDAAAAAAEDCGAPGALAKTDLVLVPRGTWNDRDPGRAAAQRLGASDPRSVVADLGILQQTLFTRAALAIQAGDADVVLVCGAEAKHRDTLAKRAGIELGDVDPSAGEPDEVLAPSGDIVTMAEIEREFVMPTHQYSAIEGALGHAEGRGPVESRAHAAALWARFAAVAAENELAWDRRGLDADAIATPGADNRVVAMPYTKLLCSQWNVDQAAALVMMAAETATALGVPRDRWVFQHRAAESNFMVPLPRRDALHRWPAFEQVAGALGLTGPGAAPPDVIDLYSCFPSAVQVQAAALGLPLDRPLTVSGGMTFGGGPLNNSVLQAMVPFARRLRERPDATGLVTSVSGMLTKPGGSTWSTKPPAEPFRATDVTAAAEAATAVHPLLPDATGGGTIVGGTVLFGEGGPARAIAVVDVDGGRTIARCTDVAVATSMAETDWIGRPATVIAPGEFEAA
jgi:acetyl-CoA C-acetyltransferase